MRLIEQLGWLLVAFALGASASHINRVRGESLRPEVLEMGAVAR